jgi:predicted enzyme related to lactoylglutathione lyase
MPYWLITTGEPGARGIDGALVPRRGPAPVEGQAVNAFVCTVDVSNINQFLTKVGAAGGTIALPKMPVPGVGWLAYAKDTEGNIFGMMQNDPNAK